MKNQSNSLSKDVCSLLIESSRSGDTAGVSQALEELQAQIKSKAEGFRAKHFLRPHHQSALEQEIRLAMVRAAEKFDENRGFPFEHYVNCSISNALKTFGRKDFTEKTHNEMISASHHHHETIPSVDATIVRNEIIGVVNSWASQLSESQLQIFQLCYREQLTLAETARKLKVSRTAVSRAHKRLKARGLEDLSNLRRHCRYFNSENFGGERVDATNTIELNS